MSLIGGMFILLLLLLVVLMIRNVFYDGYLYDAEDVETTTHTTTTTTTTTVEEPQPAYTVVGTLVSIATEDNQRYVVDPVDKDAVYVNITDDLYQDGAGKVWNLIH